MSPLTLSPAFPSASEFTVYARTGMANSVASGIVKGRPYGVVAVFVRNNLSRYITLCCHDDDDNITVAW